MDTHTIRFDRFVLDRLRRELFADGKPTGLVGKPCELLAYLIDQRGGWVARDDILENVWRGLTVGPEGVAVQIHKVRQALDRAGCEQELVLTLKQPLRYRFVGEVLPEHEACVGEVLPEGEACGRPEHLLQDDAAASVAPTGSRSGPAVPHIPAMRRRLFQAVAGILLILTALGMARRFTERPAPLSIVVIPFSYLGSDRSQSWLAEAISDDLTTDLLHIPTILPIARESANSFGRRLETPEQFGRDVKSRYLVEGDISADGGRYDINARLVETATGRKLWGQHFEVEAGRMLEARDAIVRSIGSALHFQIDQLEASRSMHDRPANPDAVGLFFQARAILDVDDRLEAFTKAQRLLEQATDHEPDFADAWAELGMMLLRKIQAVDDPDMDADRQEADDVVARALLLAPQNADALAAQARQFQNESRCADAEAAATKALSIERNSVAARRVLGNCAWMEGRLDEAVAEMRDIGALDPAGLDSKRRYIMQANIALLAGQPAEAVRFLASAKVGDPEPGPGTESSGRAATIQLYLVEAYAMLGDFPKAEALYSVYNSFAPNRTVWRIGTDTTKAVAALPGMRRILDALRAIHVPDHADEFQTTLPRGAACVPGDFNPTPLDLPGGRVVHTAELAAAIGTTNPVVIDLGQGSATVPNAFWEMPYGPAESTGAFVKAVVKEARKGRGEAEVILMGDGPFGCKAYLAARSLIADGVSHVGWYRGGEESWAVSGHAFVDRRPI